MVQFLLMIRAGAEYVWACFCRHHRLDGLVAAHVMLLTIGTQSLNISVLASKISSYNKHIYAHTRIHTTHTHSHKHTCTGLAIIILDPPSSAQMTVAVMSLILVYRYVLSVAFATVSAFCRFCSAQFWLSIAHSSASVPRPHSYALLTKSV